jgi:hypothetical protein
MVKRTTPGGAMTAGTLTFTDLLTRPARNGGDS